MSTSEHLTKEGEPDMRFKENKEAYGDDSNNQGSNNRNQDSDNYDNNQSSHNRNTSGSQKKDGGPDMRKKENQEGEPYQMDNLRGQGRGSNQDSNDNYSRNQGGNDNYSRNQDNQGQSEHLTKEGEPDMRFKENKEAYGQT